MRSDKLELLRLFVALGPSQPYGLWSRDGRLLWARLNAEISLRSITLRNRGVSAALDMFDELRELLSVLLKLFLAIALSYCGWAWATLPDLE